MNKDKKEQVSGVFLNKDGTISVFCPSEEEDVWSGGVIDTLPINYHKGATTLRKRETEIKNDESLAILITMIVGRVRKAKREIEDLTDLLENIESAIGKDRIETILNSFNDSPEEK